MGKTHDSMANVHAHGHQKKGMPAAAGSLDQDAIGETIDAMRALHKAGKTKITFARTGEVVDDSGMAAFEVTLRSVPVSD